MNTVNSNYPHYLNYLNSTLNAHNDEAVVDSVCSSHYLMSNYPDECEEIEHMPITVSLPNHHELQSEKTALLPKHIELPIEHKKQQ